MRWYRFTVSKMVRDADGLYDRKTVHVFKVKCSKAHADMLVRFFAAKRYCRTRVEALLS